MSAAVRGARSTVGMPVRLTTSATAVSERAAVWRHRDVSLDLDTRSGWSDGVARPGWCGLRCDVTAVLTGLNHLARSVSAHSSGG